MSTVDLRDSYDVVCVGGALMGSSSAYSLSENPDFDGSILVVEGDPTYESAMTTRAQNSIREQFSNTVNIRISQFGMDFIENFHDNVSVDGQSPAINFRGTGYLFIAKDDAHLTRLASQIDVQHGEGAHTRMLTPGQVKDEFPYMNVDTIVGARVGSTREGSFDGWALMQGFRQRAVCQWRAVSERSGRRYRCARWQGAVRPPRVGSVGFLWPRGQQLRNPGQAHGRHGRVARTDRASGANEFCLRLSYRDRAQRPVDRTARGSALPAGTEALHDRYRTDPRPRRRLRRPRYSPRRIRGPDLAGGRRVCACVRSNLGGHVVGWAVRVQHARPQSDHREWRRRCPTSTSPTGSVATACNSRLRLVAVSAN